MALPPEILQLHQIPQPQIILFQNITKIVSQSYIKRTIVNPPNGFAYLHLFALVLVLILGFVLGIGVMFLYLRLSKWQSKGHKAANLKRGDSQKSTAESESSGSPIKDDCPSSDSRSTSAKSSPSLISESYVKDSMVQMFLENGQCNPAAVPSQRNGLISELPNPSEMQVACVQSSFPGNKFSGNKEIADGLVQAYGLVQNPPGDYSRLLELMLKQEYSESSRSAEIPLPDTTEKIKLHQNSQDIASMKEESEIQVHHRDGRIIKIETTVNVTEYRESKTEDIKQFINDALQKKPEESASLLFMGNKRVLPALENEVQLLTEKNPSSDFKGIKSISPFPNETDEVLNPKRQASPAKELNEDRSSGADVIRLLRTPSPLCSSKPMPANQGFSHLTGFFDKVFGDKSLIGKGGFGEVYKVAHKLEQKLYAVKKVKLLVKDGEDIRQNKLFREVFAMISLHHPHIVRHHTTWTEEPPANVRPEQILKKSLSSRRLALKKKSQEALSVAAEEEEHTKISDLGFQWDVSNREDSQNNKQQISETEISSDAESLSKSFAVIKSIHKGQASVLEEEEKNSDEESDSVLNASILQKLRDHQLIYLFLQMEYCSGDSLMNYLDSPRNLKNHGDIFKIFKQILEGVGAIHEAGILHRDLKPSNIFFEKGFVKIGDFGLSWLGDQAETDLEPAFNLSHKEEIKAAKVNGYTSNIGTPFYISPEQEKSTIYDNKTDIFSLGIILFELISFFKTRHERGEKIKALREERIIEHQVSQQFPEFSKLVLNMTDKNPDKRPSAKEALALLEKLEATSKFSA